MPNARLLALQLLKTWDRSQSHAQDLLGSAFEKSTLATNDRALVQHLLFGVLRHRRLLDHWIGYLREGKLDDDTRSVLQLGLFQLFYTRIPDHAAVNETLRLATQRSRGLANAILRRATRERAHLEAMAASSSAAVRHSLPDFLHAKWTAQFGEDETEKLCQWCQTPAPNFLRRNDLRPEARQLIHDHGMNPATVSERDDFYEVGEIPQAVIDAGAGYIQDPATILACDLLAPKSGHRVLDACAAPGGKTAYIAQLMENEGTFLATDSSEERLKRLRENLDRLGVKRARPQVCDWSEENPNIGMFDRILIDVPCSNTGVLRRRVDLRWRIRPTVFEEMADLQVRLSTQILKHLLPGGHAVYSTCSIEPEENDAVVNRLLALDPTLELRKDVRSIPQNDGFDGAYAALLVKRA